jgi:hypothetical protein
MARGFNLPASLLATGRQVFDLRPQWRIVPSQARIGCFLGLERAHPLIPGNYVDPVMAKMSVGSGAIGGSRATARESPAP